MICMISKANIRVGEMGFMFCGLYISPKSRLSEAVVRD